MKNRNILLRYREDYIFRKRHKPTEITIVYDTAGGAGINYIMFKSDVEPTRCYFESYDKASYEDYYSSQITRGFTEIEPVQGLEGYYRTKPFGAYSRVGTRTGFGFIMRVEIDEKWYTLAQGGLFLRGVKYINYNIDNQTGKGQVQVVLTENAEEFDYLTVNKFLVVTHTEDEDVEDEYSVTFKDYLRDNRTVPLYYYKDTSPSPQTKTVKIYESNSAISLDYETSFDFYVIIEGERNLLWSHKV